MRHSSLVASAGSSRSAWRGARWLLSAQVVSATLTLGSLAHAQEAAPAVDAAAPSAPPVAPPSDAARDSQPSTPPPPAPAAPAAIALTTDALPARPARRIHQGLYLRLGSGPSFVTLRGHGPTGGSASITDSGAGGFIALGGAVAPGLVLAGTIQGTGFNSKFKGGPFADATIVGANGETHPASHKAQGGFGMIGVLVDWYPKPQGGWHTGLATGVGAIALTNSADDRDVAGVNFGGSVFAGYDWALGHDWSLGLQLTASGATTTKLKEDTDARVDTGYRLTPLSIGVQASLLYF
jgi:hypothetical protein